MKEETADTHKGSQKRTASGVVSPLPADQQELVNTLQTLSAREQIVLLFKASRSLSGRDKAILMSTTGFALFKDRLLPILLHFLLTRILAGAVWWFLCGLAAVLALLALALVEQINNKADVPVIVALLCFLGGFFCFSFLSFCRDILQFFRGTRPRSEIQRLQARLNAYNDTARMAVLRILGGSISQNMPGESLFSSLLTSLLVLGVVVGMVALLLALAFPLPDLGQLPWLLLIGGAALVLGFLAPHFIHRLLQARGIN